jgi:FkbM family methyltransferase
MRSGRGNGFGRIGRLSNSGQIERVSNDMATIRTLAERIFRDWVVKRRLPATFGSLPMYMSSAGGLKMLFKSVDRIDPDLLRGAQLLVRPGDVVWDIGANFGLFAMAAASRAGRDGKVVCFEPDTTLVPLLRRNAALHRSTLAEITVINAAVAGRTGIGQLNIAKRARAANALAGYGRVNVGAIAESHAVVMLSIEDTLSWLPAPKVVKIDVEGAEVEILRRGSLLLHQIRPIIFCEVDEANAQAIGDVLVEHHYAMFDAAQPLSERSRVTNPTFNTIAIPRERNMIG